MAKQQNPEEEPAGNDPQAYEIEEVVARQSAKRSESSSGEFFMKYRRLIGGAVLGVIVLVAAFFFYRDYQTEQEQEALNTAYQTFRFFEQDSFQKALTSDIGRPSLEDIASEYSGTGTGNLANYLTGVAHLEQGNLDQAVSYLEDFDPGDEMISAANYSALATAYEEKGDFAKAAELYEKAAGINENSQTSPFFLQNAARCLEEGNDLEAALEMYKRIKREYPNSPEGQNVEKYIYRLSV